MWLKELQIAIIEKNSNEIDRLIDSMPMYDRMEDMQAAASLLKEANKLMMTLKEETAESMSKIKKTKDFLEATRSKDSSLFDSKI